MFTILVAEDDVRMNGIYCDTLKANDFDAVPAFDGEQALELMAENKIDLLLSDIMMPCLDGYELTKQVREFYPELPILMISAKESYEDKRYGFLAGTDDYMVKPVDLNEMILRIYALLRRAKSVSERKLQIGGTVLDLDTHTVNYAEDCIELPKKEFLILYKLMSCTDRTFTRRQLMDEFWEYDSESEERTVDVHINRIRDKLKDCQDIEILTVRGLGYRGKRI
ncbi:MAG: response regulator transcription factor [Clostridia bacterium]|nr:response regulator transcription factor [Clostridia bacterium]